MTAITKNGRVFRGTAVGGFPSAYKISDGRVSCSGQLALDDDHHDYTLPTTCSNGLTGIVIFNGSGGTLRLSDGTEGTFIIGNQAARL